jgi:peptidoglycan/xylan/chitin deacetylase (PgdA/CDA1 family)
MFNRLVKLFISLIFWWFESGIRCLLRILKIESGGTCVVLYYHVVDNNQRKQFARQMDCLIKNAEPISLDRVPVFKAGVRYVAITIDDGFLDSIENAVLELVKRNIPVTIFIPTGCLGSYAPWLKDDQAGDHGGFVMKADHIREFGRNKLVSFGSHCITHSNLLSLDEEEAKKEIYESKIQLEKILGEKVKTLSFPHGACNSQHVKWAKAAGYERVFSILPSLAFSRPYEFVTGRVRVDPTDWQIEFWLKFLGAYRWMPLASFLKRKATSFLLSAKSSISPSHSL